MWADLTEALAHYDEAARLSPDSPDLHFALAQAYARGGRWSEAILSLERAAALARASGRGEALQKIEDAIAQCQARIRQ